MNFLLQRGHSRLDLRHVRKLTAFAVTANSPAKDCKHGSFHGINHSVVETKPPVAQPIRRGKEKCFDTASPECLLSIGPSLHVQRSEFYFRLFKAGGETVKEISFDAGLSLPALS